MIAYFDMFSGISGDMVLGAFVSLGVPVEWLCRQFESMPLPEAGIRVESVFRSGIKCVNLFVDDLSDPSNSDPSNMVEPYMAERQEEKEPGHRHTHQLHTHHDHTHHDHTHHDMHPGHDTHQDHDIHHGHDHADGGHSHFHPHHSEHGDTHHHHDNSGLHKHLHGSVRVSRNYAQIKDLISSSPFSEYVKSSSLRAFDKIAVAESEIHGTTIEKVHFHEVGGVDSIVDIVGAFLCAEYLGIDKVYGSIPSVGSGFVKCSHGMIPVPAPATIKILEGVPVREGRPGMELVTPTGAAIITTFTESFGSIPEMVVKKSGYGSGKKIPESGPPNILRIITGEERTGVKKIEEKKSAGPKSVSVQDSDGLKPGVPENCEADSGRYFPVLSYPSGSSGSSCSSEEITFSTDHISKEIVYVLETSIDDMNPEIEGFLMEKLLEIGALDVTYTPVIMKKNRPAARLEVIAKKERVDELVKIILTESTSSGVRFYRSERAVLAREKVEIETPLFGKVAAKKIVDPEGRARMVPEYDICRKLAAEKGMTLRDVYSHIAGLFFYR